MKRAVKSGQYKFRNGRGKVFVVIVSVMVLLILSFVLGGCSPAREEVVLDLVDHYGLAVPQKKMVQLNQEGARITRTTHGGVTKRSLVIDREWKIEFYFPCPESVSLRFWLGLNLSREEGLSNFGGECNFDLSIETDRGAPSRTYTFDRRLDSLARAWSPCIVKLDDYAGEIVKVTISFKQHQYGGMKFFIGDPCLIGRKALSAAIDIQNAEAENIQRPGQNLMIILVDTVRADKPGFNGNPTIHNPNLDKLAKKGITFSRVFSSSSWTKPAIGTLFTGLPAVVHNASTRGDVLSDKVLTLSELFRRNNYRTCGVISNANVSDTFGFERGFDDYILGQRPDSKITGAVLKRLANLGSRPFFFYVHYGDPHFPYQIPKPLRTMYDLDYEGDYNGLLNSLQRLSRLGEDRANRDVRHVSALYEAEITWTDIEIGKILRALHQLGIRDRTSVLFLSDHGDEFFEHGGFTHGKTLYNEVISVPMILAPARYKKGGTVFNGHVRYVDIFPTVAELFTLPFKKISPIGHSLVPALSADRESEFTESYDLPDIHHLKIDDRFGISFSRDGFKIIQMKNKPLELYDIQHDSSERQNLAELYPVHRGFYRYLLKAYQNKLFMVNSSLHGQYGELTPREFDKNTLRDDVRENLQALGYIE